MNRRFFFPRYIGEAVLAFVFLITMRVVGLDLASRIGAGLARALGPRLPRHRLARENLARAFPDLDAARIEEILNCSWDNLGRTMAEYAHLKKFRTTHRERIEISWSDKARAEIIARQGRVLFFSGHFANWELMPLGLALVDLPTAEIYRPPNNPYVDFWLQRQRCRAILPIQIPKGRAGSRALVRAVKEDRAFAVLVDQKSREGIPLRFFNHPATSNTMPAVFALRYGYALTPVHIERLEGARFRLVFHDPLPVESTGREDADVIRITGAVNAFLEARIRDTPAQWLWIHDRWQVRKPA